MHQSLEGKAPSQVKCQTAVFDALQKKYKNSSAAVIARRLSLYQQLLKAGQLNFTNIFTDESEALRSTLTDDFYQTAVLWGDDFKIALDLHFLNEASHAYKALCESGSVLQFSQSRQLALQVFSSSLCDSVYLQALRELLEKSVVHASCLQFDIRRTSYEVADQPDTLRKLLGEFGEQQLASSKHSLREHKNYNICLLYTSPSPRD